MQDAQDHMLRITGYTDRLSVRPGEAITFYVHSERDESYRANIVRLIHGDTSPEGPGFKDLFLFCEISVWFSYATGA